MKTTIRSGAFILAVSLAVACNENNTTTSDTNTESSSSSHSAKDTAGKMDNMKMNHGMMSSMNATMDRMKAVQMTGDFDIDFANMMIEHHQGGIDMSEQELSSGKDEKLKSMAQKIITSQKDEIAKLRDFVRTYKPSGMKHGEGELGKDMSAMESKMKSMQMSGDVDKDFAMMMKEHHAVAVAMSKKVLTHGMSEKLKQMAQKTITEQNKEIKEFENWLNNK
jgi:uncharacterized protein (DUF305 family)